MSTNQNIMKCIGFYFCIHWYNDSLRVVAGARGWGWGPARTGAWWEKGLDGSCGWEHGLGAGAAYWV